MLRLSLACTQEMLAHIFILCCSCSFYICMISVDSFSFSFSFTNAELVKASTQGSAVLYVDVVVTDEAIEMDKVLVSARGGTSASVLSDW